jgi:hypothetical protein
MQLSFGSGAIWGERTDTTGSGIGPRQFGVLQEIQIDFDWSDKELYGQRQFPIAIARGQGKITGKAKFAQILGLLYSDIFFGLTPATGQFAVAQLKPLPFLRQRLIPSSPLMQLTTTTILASCMLEMAGALIG